MLSEYQTSVCYFPDAEKEAFLRGSNGVHAVSVPVLQQLFKPKTIVQNAYTCASDQLVCNWNCQLSGSRVTV